MSKNKPAAEQSPESGQSGRQWAWAVLGFVLVVVGSLLTWFWAECVPWLQSSFLWLVEVLRTGQALPLLLVVLGLVFIAHYASLRGGNKPWLGIPASANRNPLKWGIGTTVVGFLVAVGGVTMLGTWWWFGGDPWRHREVDKVPPAADLVKDPSDTVGEGSSAVTDPSTPQSGAGDWSFLYLNQPPSPLEVAQMAFAITTTIGGAAFLVISYRKSRRDEEVEVREKKEEERAERKAFAEHFGTAAEQLSSDDVTRQLVGLYAMANLARAHRPEKSAAPEARRNTQQCIDTICSFVRLMEIPGVGSAPVGGLRGVSGDTDESAQSGATRREIVPSADQRRFRNAQQIALDLLIDLMPSAPSERVDRTGREEDGSDREISAPRERPYRFDFAGANLRELRLNSEKWEHRGQHVTIEMRDAKLGGADLSRADLSCCNLNGANLDKAKLTGTHLERIYVNDVSFNGTIMEGVFLNNAKLRNCSFTSVHMRGARVRNAILDNAIFKSVNLQKADFTGSRFHGLKVDYVDAQEGGKPSKTLKKKSDLSRGVFIGVDMTLSNLQGVDLTEADMSEARLNCANMSGACMERAVLELSDLQGAEFTDAVLSGARLNGADLHGAKMSGAYLEGAQMIACHFGSTVLSGANMKDVSLALECIMPEYHKTLLSDLVQEQLLEEFREDAKKARSSGNRSDWDEFRKRFSVHIQDRISDASLPIIRERRIEVSLLAILVSDKDLSNRDMSLWEATASWFDGKTAARCSDFKSIKDWEFIKGEISSIENIEWERE